MSKAIYYRSRDLGAVVIFDYMESLSTTPKNVVIDYLCTRLTELKQNSESHNIDKTIHISFLSELIDTLENDKPLSLVKTNYTKKLPT
jgi:hypothetical protein